jgi:hypothetical protein
MKGRIEVQETRILAKKITAFGKFEGKLDGEASIAVNLATPAEFFSNLSFGKGIAILCTNGDEPTTYRFRRLSKSTPQFEQVTDRMLLGVK